MFLVFMWMVFVVRVEVVKVVVKVVVFVSFRKVVIVYFLSFVFLVGWL